MEPTTFDQGLCWEVFLNNLVASTLLPTEEIEHTIAGKSKADVVALAYSLVEAGLLTVYQMEAISRGRHMDLRIGRYHVLDEIGAGGMGTVYKARHSRMKRIVALKVLSQSLSKDDDFVRRFQREVETIAQLNHPNIVLAYDAGDSDMGQFLVMELVNGQDLASQVKRRGPLSVAEAVDCILQAARGLEYVHQQGMIHRDVKPANLLRDVSGVVKVADLGLARLSGAANPNGGITQTGGILGTVDFMPPEQAVDSTKLDGRADVYSLAATMHFLLFGQPPYSGETFMATLLKHRDAPIPSLAAGRPEVPAELESLFRRMMSKAPSGRPASMSEVVRVLEDIVKVGCPGRAVVPAASAMEASLKTVVLPPVGTVHDKLSVKVLLVEPSRTQLSIIRKYLQDQDIPDVVPAVSGQEALKAFRTNRPGAVICALHLPDMTGVQLAQQIRAESQTASPGFVLISSEPESSQAGTLSKCGPAVLLHKPFTPEKLVEALGTVLGQAQPVNVDGTVANVRAAPHAGVRGKLCVLLVDDSSAARLHERNVLQSLGFVHFVEAADGAQAVVAAARDHFDLIVTDYNMPHMDGKGLIGYLKENPATATVPILMVTTETDPARLEEVRRLGVEVCDKSFSTETLKNIVDPWFPLAD